MAANSNHRNLILSLIAASLACGSLYALSAGSEARPDLFLGDTPALSLSPDSQADTDENVSADSAALILANRLEELATESYKRIVKLKADGESYDVLFPAIYDCYEKNLKVLEAAPAGSQVRRQALSSLINLDPELLSGAYFYSGKSDQRHSNAFIEAYVDVQLIDDLKEYNFKRNPKEFPKIVYIAATNAFNAREYDRAIGYFKLYLSTGASDYRENVIMGLGQSAYNMQNYDLAVATLSEGLKQYPFNETIAKLGVLACRDGGHGEALQDFLTAVLQVAPDDPSHLDLQGKLYEDDHKYDQAIEIYTRLDDIRPNDISTAKHLAICYFNMGVQHFNDAVYTDDDKQARKSRRLAKNYFGATAQKAQEITARDPLNVKFLTILAKSYLCLEEKEKFDEINHQLTALGQDPLSEMFMPAMVNYNESNTKNFDYVYGSNSLSDQLEAPAFTEYSRNFVVEAMNKWTVQGEFERNDDYAKRVNDVTIRQHIDELTREAEQTYLDTYGKKLRISDMKLLPYDASNETFLVETSYGNFTLKVPLKDGEAERFKSGWDTMNFRNPRYYIEDDQVRIASITVEASGGKSYSYDVTRSATYQQNRTLIDYESILSELVSNNRTQVAKNENEKETTTITKKSDVDVNIPRTSKVQSNTFALIIANENYKKVQGMQTRKVASALHDGEVFKQYCTDLLGIPESNIIMATDASFGIMTGSIAQFIDMAGSFGKNADVIVYYTGHGVPDERTKDAFMLPVDGISNRTNTCYSLNKFYRELGEIGANSVTVFIDACFSGSQRDGSMHYAARGVAIASNDSPLSGNTFVLSASSGIETAADYPEKNHGLFTYFLLKKLQESKGNVTLEALADYVVTNVKQKSAVVNKKQQTPRFDMSDGMVHEWRKHKLLK